MSKILRVIGDAGHGPNTPGKRSPDGKLREFQFNKPVTERFKEILETEFEGVEVRLVADHKGTTDVPLATRTNIANSWPADVYVSIHANANTGQWGDWTGIETFVYTTLPKTATALAQVVQCKLIKATGMRDRGVKAKDLHVLRETKMPAILVECGFMDSRIDFPKLMSTEYREACARAIAEGVAEFFGLKRKKQAQPKQQAKNQTKKEGKINMLKAAVVINSFADFPAAEAVATRYKAPIFLRSFAQGEIAETVYVVGGIPEGIKAKKVVNLSGKNRYETASKVGKHLGSL